MTLDEMIQQCAIDVDESPLSKSGGVYTGNSLLTANKFISGINYAYRKIAKEKYRLRYTEQVTLDENRSFTTSFLSQAFIKLFSIEDANGYSVGYIEKYTDTIQCPNQQPGTELTITYAYLPDKLVNLTDTPLFPETKVDHRLLCYFGDFEFLNIETDDTSATKAQMYMTLFNDGLDSISETSGSPTTIKVPTSAFRAYSPLD